MAAHVVIESAPRDCTTQMMVVAASDGYRLGHGLFHRGSRSPSLRRGTHCAWIPRIDRMLTCPKREALHSTFPSRLWALNGDPEPTMKQPLAVGSQLHPVGEVLQGKYRVEDVLGTGGNATTLKCVRLEDRKWVAVKFISLRTVHSWKQIELFEREAQVLQQLSHPSIPAYVDSFEIDTATDKRFYIVQEIAEGISLAQLVERGTRFSEDEVVRIATELLEVLMYLSKLQPPVIHRDVKPENVILGAGIAGGRVYLVDFGGVQGIELDSGSTIVGTYGYMAPEQFRGMAASKSDLYGLGATLLYLISGRHPTSFGQERLKIDFADSITTSDELLSLLDGLLEPLPEDRFSANEALETLRGGTGDVSRYRPWRPRKKAQPAGARSRVRRRGNTTLQIDIPAAGLGGADMAAGTFAIAWNAFVLFWSYSALVSGGILPLLFSIPFWYAGWEITKLSLFGCLLHQNLKMNSRTFTLTKELSFLRNREATPVDETDALEATEDQDRAKKQIKGKTRDLSKAEIVTSAVVNGTPQTCIEFSEGVQSHVFAEGLARLEQEWLVDEINDTLLNIQER